MRHRPREGVIQHLNSPQLSPQYLTGLSVATASYYGYNERLAEDAEHLSGTALKRIARTGGQECKQLVELTV